jgi:hypothetical protein
MIVLFLVAIETGIERKENKRKEIKRERERERNRRKE